MATNKSKVLHHVKPREHTTTVQKPKKDRGTYYHVVNKK